MLHSVAKATSDKGIRRSTRHHKLRGEKALVVSANQTLKELKIQVKQLMFFFSSQFCIVFFYYLHVDVSLKLVLSSETQKL